jgi:hypothetical protein
LAKSTILGDEDRKDRRGRTTRVKRRLALLGLFVQSFEDVVSVIRENCISINQGFRRGVEIPQTKIGHHVHISSIIFNHRSMTASPLIDLWRALNVMQIYAMDDVDEIARQNYFSIIDQITKDCITLYERRNEVVHANWRMDTPSEDFPLSWKFGVGKRGLKELADMPRTEADLKKLITGCRRQFWLLFMLKAAIEQHPDGLAQRLKRDSTGRWHTAVQYDALQRKLK